MVFQLFLRIFYSKLVKILLIFSSYLEKTTFFIKLFNWIFYFMTYCVTVYKTVVAII